MNLYPMEVTLVAEIVWGKKSSFQVFSKKFDVPPGCNSITVTPAQLDTMLIEFESVTWDTDYMIYKAVGKVKFVGWFTPDDFRSGIISNGWEHHRG